MYNVFLNFFSISFFFINLLACNFRAYSNGNLLILYILNNNPNLLTDLMHHNRSSKGPYYNLLRPAEVNISQYIYC